MTRLIDADLLTTKISFVGFPHIDRNGRIDKSCVYELINNAPTVEERLLGERVDGEPKGKCKNCKAYRQYGSRADGYCDISRMTAEGMSHINVNEDFYCSYFEEADND